jgi:hypothetical protein
VTCEVRIGDVVNSESSNIYRQLAGGATIMHLLHGSCNAIGGQCAVIKNKWGSPPTSWSRRCAADREVRARREPKQSNWGADATGRYPQSRAGVEQVIRDGVPARAGLPRAMAEWKQGTRRAAASRPPARAVSEIIEGKRLIHCHSYRQDEMLMLLRLAESFGFRVNTLTHIQEAYKVADEIATHGASAMGSPTGGLQVRGHGWRFHGTATSCGIAGVNVGSTPTTPSWRAGSTPRRQRR